MNRGVNQAAKREATPAVDCVPSPAMTPALHRGDKSATRAERRATIVGMLFSSIWLLFLVFPVVAAWYYPPVPRAISLGLTAGFAACYLVGIRLSFGSAVPGERNWRYFDGRHRFRWDSFAAFAVLLGLVGCQMLLLEPGVALNFLPFLVAMGCFSLPLLWGCLFGVMSCLLSISLAFISPHPEALIGVSIACCGVFFSVLGTTFFISNAMAQQRQARTDAIASERDRVARDVHDVLGHSLTVIALKSELAGKLVSRDPGRAQAEIAAVTDLARGAIEELRATVGGLRVQDLASELEGARQACEAAGIKLQIRGEAAAVAPQFQAVFAWVTREAITNVIRHSGASRAEITLGARHLEVRDNGRGIPAGSVGNGLRGLQERVSDLGGILKITNLADAAGAAQEAGATGGADNPGSHGTKLEVML